MLDFQPTSSWLETFPQGWVKPIFNSSTQVVSGYLLKQCLVVHQTYPLPGRNSIDEEFICLSPTNSILDNQPIYRRAKKDTIAKTSGKSQNIM